MLVSSASIGEKSSELKIGERTFLIHNSLLGAAYPSALSLESTNFCNLACSHCGHSQFSKFSKGHFDMRYLHKVEHLLGSEIKNLSLSDFGEPFISRVWPDLLRSALAIEGLTVSFITNGLLLDRHIEEIMDPRIWMAVSVDGASEKTYGYFRGKTNFSRLISNLTRLKKIKEERGVSYPHTTMLFTVSRINCHELTEFVELAKGLDAETVIIQFQLFFDHSRFERESLYFSKEDYDRHIASASRRAQELRIKLIHPDSFDGLTAVSRDAVTNSWLGRDAQGAIQCYAHLSTCYIKYNGVIDACCAPNRLAMGNLDLDSFEDIWHGPRYRELRLAFDQGKWPVTCTHCNLIQAVDPNDERAHFVDVSSISRDTVSAPQDYRVSEIDHIYREALSLLPVDCKKSLTVLSQITGISDNLYEIGNLAACLHGLLGDIDMMTEQLKKFHGIAPKDTVISKNYNTVAGITKNNLFITPPESSEEIVLEMDKLTKIFRLYDNPSARLKELFSRRDFHRKFTALDNVSIAVKKGETLGIIGENGAGKSTLLKIISRTLKATEGSVKITGRVSSLLELGTGFHPEFTGIENIYFYGSLLGIPPSEMKQRIKEIVSFAEIGEHIDYPLKTYSAGMYVRLAFSVAMAADPDILVVDEALSVGDLYFQKKSTDKILSFKEKGKTIIFCSHSMYYINRLCDRVIWLKNGQIAMEGLPHPVTQEYETYQLKKEEGKGEETPGERQEEKGAVALVLIRNIIITPFPMVRCGDDLNIEIEITTIDKSISYRVAAVLLRVDGINIVGIGTKDHEPLHGDRKVHLCFPSIQIKEGTFFIKIHVMDENFVHIFDSKASSPFTVPKESVEPGFLNIPYKWII